MTIPYRFQLEDVRKIHKFGGRCLIAHSMGLGKSFLSLLYAQRHPEVRPIIVICPASLKWNWEREAKIHINMPCEILEGMTIPKNYGMKSSPQLVIVNYDILKAWLPYLTTLKPKLIIIDEAQCIVHRASQRSKATRQLCKTIPHILALSGTPLTNRPSELWNILNLLRPDLYPSFFSFAQVHCEPKLKPWGWEYNGAANLPLLHENLTSTFMLRRRKEDVLSELPKKQRIVLPMDIVNRKDYNAAVADFMTWLKKQSRSSAKKAKLAQGLVKLGTLKRLAGEFKLPSVMEWIDNFLEESDEKLIVFGVHKKVIKPLEEKYKKICVLVDGSTIGKERQKAVDQFNRNDKTRLFIGNIKAAGSGWSCTSASTVAFCELDWTSTNHAQAEDRISGIGRGVAGVASQIFYLIARNTVEEKLCDFIQLKQKTLNRILDGEGKGDELDIFDLLVESLGKGNQ